MKDTDRKNRVHKEKEKEFDVVPLLKALLTKLWLILLVGFIVGSVAFGVTKLTIRPTYRCKFTAYVNNQHAQAEKDTLTNSDIVAAQQLTKTYSYIIRSNTVLSESLKSIGSDMTHSQASHMVSTEIKDETELISVYVINEDPETAYELANAIAKTAPSCMANIVEGSSMKIVDYPEMPTERYGPSYLKYAILGFMLGAFVVMVIVIVRFLINDTIDDELLLESRFSLPVLGVLPDVNSLNKEGYGYYYSGSGYEYSAYGSGKEQSK